MKRTLVMVLSMVMVAGLVTAVFGNACSVRRQPGDLDLSSTGSPSSTPAPATTATKIVTEAYFGCLSSSTSLANVPACIVARGGMPSSMEATMSAALTACSAENTHPIFLGICLSKNGVVVDKYRLPLQADINNCLSKVTVDKLAGCMDKNGFLPPGLTQATINTCLTKVAPDNLEKCLRLNGYLPTYSVLTQFDVDLCGKVAGAGSANIYECLSRREIIPLTAGAAQFLQTDLDGCINPPGPGQGSIVKCLRKNVKISRALLGAHIDRCIEIVGVAKLAACLNANGIAPLVLGNAITQAQIDTCVAKRGVTDISYCLRWDLGALNKVVSQGEIAECTRIAGASGLAKCLYQAGILPEGVNQDVLDTCSTAIANTAGATLTKCLRKNSYLPKALVQGDVNTCLRLVDSTRAANCLNANVASFANLEQANIDTCVANPAVGEAGIAKCLKKNNFIPSFLSQEHLNACAAHGGGTANISACLEASGFVGLSGTSIPQGTIDTCVGSVGLKNLRACLGKNGYLSTAIDAAATEACTLFVGAANVDACYAANGLK